MAELKVLFVAGFGPVVRDYRESLEVYGATLRLPLLPMPQQPDYYHSDSIEGVKHFALWPLHHAAQSCFGEPHWPGDIASPQAWLELEVEDLAGATQTLQARGHRLLVAGKLEPWGQTVSRFLSPEGMLVSLTHTPWLRNAAQQ